MLMLSERGGERPMTDLVTWPLVLPQTLLRFCCRSSEGRAGVSRAEGGTQPGSGAAADGSCSFLMFRAAGLQLLTDLFFPSETFQVQGSKPLTCPDASFWVGLALFNLMPIVQK